MYMTTWLMRLYIKNLVESALYRMKIYNNIKENSFCMSIQRITKKYGL